MKLGMMMANTRLITTPVKTAKKLSDIPPKMLRDPYLSSTFRAQALYSSRLFPAESLDSPYGIMTTINIMFSECRHWRMASRMTWPGAARSPSLVDSSCKNIAFQITYQSVLIRSTARLHIDCMSSLPSLQAQIREQIVKEVLYNPPWHCLHIGLHLRNSWETFTDYSDKLLLHKV